MNIGARTGTNSNTNGTAGYPAAILTDRTQPLDWGKIRPHGHTVQFYEDDKYFVDELGRFIGSALGAGDAAVVIATKEHRTGLAKRLKASGLDVSAAARQGRYIALGAQEILDRFMLGDRPDPDRFAAVLGPVMEQALAQAVGENPRLAAFGEMVAILWAQEMSEAAMELEHLWNALAQTYSFELRCGYHMGLFSGSAESDPVGKICGAHSEVIPAESYMSLAHEDERLRAIAVLQQKARALENEVEERKKAQEYLERAVAARDEFLSVAAHELKTPITSLRGFAQLLLRDTRRNREIPVERLASSLGVIEIQAEKLTNLVARLLDSAQIEAGKLRIEPCTTDLADLIASQITHYEDKTGHTLVYRGPEHLDALIDPVRFEQVITNLLDNAIKYSPHGGTVTVELGRKEDGGIKLSVTDQGLGIPVEQRDAIFERFHQAHGVEHLSGMGFGLYVTRQIVELHGGSIELEETGGPGARFVVSLPASLAAQSAQTSAAALQAEPGHSCGL